jgi:hypothetical protein
MDLRYIIYYTTTKIWYRLAQKELNDQIEKTILASSVVKVFKKTLDLYYLKQRSNEINYGHNTFNGRA